MNFSPQDMDVKTLFKTYPTFRIPVFQRDYSWDKQFYKRFIDDIISGINSVGDSLSNNVYFIGTMVFSGNSNENSIDVVDGQQRLTVITILLSVISNKLMECGEKGLSDATFRYVKDINDNDEPIRHLISDTSYPYFDCYVQSKEKTNIPEVETEEEENIKQTYDFFNIYLSCEKLKEQNLIFKDFDYVKILLAVRDQILESKLIAIVTSDKDSAYMIFEILNAKGKNLASIDLIKNIVFEKLHNDKNGGIGYAESVWEGVKKTLRDRDGSIGLATFYRHYWISKFKKETNNKLYDSFKSYIKKDEYLDFLKDLEKESKNYISIVNPKIEDHGNRQEYKWLVQSLQSFGSIFNVVQSRIILLALLDIKKRELISTPSFKKAIQYLENFIFAYTNISKKQANIYETNFSKLAIKLRKTESKSGTNTILNELLYDTFNSKLPKYEEFEEGFVRLAYSGRKNLPTNVLAKYVLKKLNQYFEKRDFFSDDTSVEHIVNEKSEDNDTCLIGNLICLETRLNNDASDLKYIEKREVYNKSKYEQVKTFISEYSDFDIEAAKVRSKKMAREYYDFIICDN